MAIVAKDQTEILSDLSLIYEEHGLALMLGAGVSVSSGLPTWKQLAERIMIHDAIYGPVAGAEKFLELERVGYRLETIIGMAEDKILNEKGDDRFAAQRAFASVVRECLYAGFDFWQRDINSETAPEFLSFIETSNTTLRSAYDLSVLRSGDNGELVANPKVRAIVNFNLDALLQAYDKARHIQMRGGPSSDKTNRRLRTIERPTASVKPDKISVYHPHGFLRFDSKRDKSDKEAPDLRILTEYEYYDFYNKPMEMYTYTLLHMFRECHCMFLGLSMADENLRRLLHYSRDEEIRSFERERPDFRAPNRLRHFAVLPRSQDDRDHVDRLVENSLARLGVNVLWVKQFAEIPPLLGGLAALR